MDLRNPVPDEGSAGEAGRPSDFVLREMEAHHLPAVLEIEEAAFSNSWRRQEFEYSMRREGGRCLVALSGEAIVGYSVGFLVSDEFHLADFAIHPTLQRRGLGVRLLGRVLEDLKGRSVNLVTLEVRASNAAAIGLYRGAGFQIIAVREGYYSLPKEDAFVMLKALRGKATDWAETESGFRFRGAQSP